MIDGGHETILEATILEAKILAALVWVGFPPRVSPMPQC
jgi:hypothetical protein